MARAICPDDPNGVSAVGNLIRPSIREAIAKAIRIERDACKAIALRATVALPADATLSDAALWIANEIGSQ